MAKLSETDVWKEITGMAKKDFGDQVFGTEEFQAMKSEFFEYWRESELELESWDDVETTAFDFYKTQKPRLRRAIQPPESISDQDVLGKARKEKPGSILRLVTYAELLPWAIKARTELYGRKEPLSIEGATAWVLERQGHGEERLEFWTLNLTFRCPVTPMDGVLDRNYYQQKEESPGETFALLLKNHKWGSGSKGLDSDERLRWYLGSPLTRTRTLKVPQLDKPWRENPDIYWRRVMLNRGRLVVLAEWIDFLSPAFSSEDDAAWFILAGEFQPSRLRASLLNSPGDLERRKFPFQHRISAISLNILDPDITPEYLAEFYSKVRKEWGFSSKGRSITEALEVLGLMALEVIHYEGIEKGQKGYYGRVLERWTERAKDFGADPKKFANAELVRKALERIDRSYAALSKVRVLGHELPPEEVSLFRKLSE